MKIRLALVAVVLLLSATAANAQTGCVNSPECPTAVLAAAGTAAFALFRRIKR